MDTQSPSWALVQLVAGDFTREIAPVLVLVLSLRVVGTFAGRVRRFLGMGV